MKVTPDISKLMADYIGVDVEDIKFEKSSNKDVTSDEYIKKCNDEYMRMFANGELNTLGELDILMECDEIPMEVRKVIMAGLTNCLRKKYN